MGAVVFNNASALSTGVISISTTTFNIDDVREFTLTGDTWIGAGGTAYTYITLSSTVSNVTTSEVVKLINVQAGAATASSFPGTFTLETASATKNAYPIGTTVELRISAELVRDLSTDGKTILNGTVDPSTAAPVTGATNGDFYINTTTTTLFGPVVVAGTTSTQVWPTGKALIGASGSTVLGTDSVTTVTIKDLNVTSDKLSANAVTTAKITDLNITSGKLAANSVITDKIVDANVTTAKIADNAVTTAKITALNVTEAKIGTAAVTKTKIGLLAVDAARLQAGVPSAANQVLTSSTAGVLSWADAAAVQDVASFTTKALRNASTTTNWDKGDLALISAGVDQGTYVYTGTNQATAGVTLDAVWTKLVTPDTAAAQDVVTFTTTALRNAATTTNWNKGDLAIVTAVGTYVYIGTNQTTPAVTLDAAWVLMVSATGAAGVDGKTILNGTAAPTALLPLNPTNGDFYIHKNTGIEDIYGPRVTPVSGNLTGWGTATSLIGTPGTPGGATGPGVTLKINSVTNKVAAGGTPSVTVTTPTSGAAPEQTLQFSLVTGDTGATGATGTAISALIEDSYEASEAIKIGEPVVLNSNGTVSGVGETFTASAASYPTSATLGTFYRNSGGGRSSIAFDPNLKGSFVIAHGMNPTGDTNSFRVAVTAGRVNADGTIEFASSPTILDSVNSKNKPYIEFDPNHIGRFLVAWSSVGANRGTWSLNTVTGLTITPGANDNFESSQVGGASFAELSISWDKLTNNRFAVVYNASTTSVREGRMVVGTATTDTGRVFTKIPHQQVQAKDTSGAAIFGGNSFAFDPRVAGNFAIAYRSAFTGLSNSGTIRIGTMASNGTATIAAPVTFSAANDLGRSPNFPIRELMTLKYDPNQAGKFALAYTLGLSGSAGVIKICSVSGTTLTVPASSTGFASNVNDQMDMDWSTINLNTLVVAFSSANAGPYFKLGTVGATSNTVTFNDGLGTPGQRIDTGAIGNSVSVAIDPSNQGRFVVAYNENGGSLRTGEVGNGGYAKTGKIATTVITTNLTTNSFLGFAKAAYTKSVAGVKDAVITIKGGLANNLQVDAASNTNSALQAGFPYYVLKDGKLSTTVGTPIVRVGVSDSTSSIRVQNSDVILPTQSVATAGLVLTSNGSATAWTAASARGLTGTGSRTDQAWFTTAAGAGGSYPSVNPTTGVYTKATNDPATQFFSGTNTVTLASGSAFTPTSTTVGDYTIVKSVGEDGKTVLSGTAVPNTTTANAVSDAGAVGDYYLRTTIAVAASTGVVAIPSQQTMFGPRLATTTDATKGWGTGVAVTGATGAAGTNGVAVNPLIQETYEASGILPSGAPVVLLADGTVQVAAETVYTTAIPSSGAVPTIVPQTGQSGVTNVTAEKTRSVFRKGTVNQFILMYRDETPSSPTLGLTRVIIGVITGTVITFPSPAVSVTSTAIGQVEIISTSADRFVVGYNESGGKARVGSISGTTISFNGSVATFEANNLNTSSSDVALAQDPINANRIVAVFHVNGSTIRSQVGIISDEALNFPRLTDGPILLTTDQQPSISVDFDPGTPDQFVVSYSRGATNPKVYCVVGTVTGTVGAVPGSTITYGVSNAVTFDGSQSGYHSIKYIPTRTSSFLVAFTVNDTSGANPSNSVGRVILGTIAGTGATSAITYAAPVADVSGNATQFFGTRTNASGGPKYASLAIDPKSPNTFIVAFSDVLNSDRPTVQVGTLNGNAVSISTVKNVLQTVRSQQTTTFYDPNNIGKFVSTYVSSQSKGLVSAIVGQTLGTETSLTASNFIGFSNALYPISAGGVKDAIVTIAGGTAANIKIDHRVTSANPLEAGFTYYLAGTGVLSRTASVPLVEVGVSQSTSTILVRNINNELPVQSTITNGRVLTSNGSTASWSTAGANGLNGTSSRTDIAWFTALDGSGANLTVNAYPSGLTTATPSTYKVATRVAQGFRGERFVSWTTTETAVSTSVADYTIYQVKGDQGVIGITPTLTAKAIGTVAPASTTTFGTPIATFSGTELQLTLPAGLKGDKGDASTVAGPAGTGGNSTNFLVTTNALSGIIPAGTPLILNGGRVERVRVDPQTPAEQIPIFSAAASQTATMPGTPFRGGGETGRPTCSFNPLDPTKFVITYSDGADGDVVKAVIGTVDTVADTMTFGTPINIATNDTSLTSTVQIPAKGKDAFVEWDPLVANRVVVVWINNQTNIKIDNELHMSIGTVVGTAITFGTKIALSTQISSTVPILGMDKITPGLFTIAYLHPHTTSPNAVQPWLHFGNIATDNTVVVSAEINYRHGTGFRTSNLGLAMDPFTSGRVLLTASYRTVTNGTQNSSSIWAITVPTAGVSDTGINLQFDNNELIYATAVGNALTQATTGNSVSFDPNTNARGFFLITYGWKNPGAGDDSQIVVRGGSITAANSVGMGSLSVSAVLSSVNYDGGSQPVVAHNPSIANRDRFIVSYYDNVSTARNMKVFSGTVSGVNKDALAITQANGANSIHDVTGQNQGGTNVSLKFLPTHSSNAYDGKFLMVYKGANTTSTATNTGAAKLGQIGVTRNVSNLTAAGFIGVSNAAAVASTAASTGVPAVDVSVSVALQGGLATNLTLASTSAIYYVQPDGTYATTVGSPVVELGKAVTATTLLIKDADVSATVASTATVNAGLPSQAAQTGKFLKTDGTTASWADGIAGPGITSALVNASNQLVIDFDTVGKADYTSASLKGETGAGITSVVLNASNQLVVDFDTVGKADYTSASLKGDTGKTILNGTGNPNTTGTGGIPIAGNTGDFFIDTTNNLLYGPRTSDSVSVGTPWGTNTVVIKGSKGDAGTGGNTAIINTTAVVTTPPLGVLANRDPVILNALGLVEKIGITTNTFTRNIPLGTDATSSAAGFGVKFDTGKTTRDTSIAFDNTSGKLLIAYRNSLSGISVVIGRVVTGALVFISPPTVISSGQSSSLPSIKFNPNVSGDFVVVWHNGSGGSASSGEHTQARGGRISAANTISSLGVVQTLKDTGGTAYVGSTKPKISFDSKTIGQFAIAIANGSASERLEVIVGTMTGVEVVLRNSVKIPGTTFSSNFPNIEFNPAVANQFVATYIVDSGATGPAGIVLGTVTSSTVTYQTPIIFDSDRTNREISLGMDPLNVGRFIIAWSGGGGKGNRGSVIVGTITSTLISFGVTTPTTFNEDISGVVDRITDNVSIAVDPNNAGSFVINYTDRSATVVSSGYTLTGQTTGNVIALSGTTAANRIGTPVLTSNNITVYIDSAFDPSVSGRFVTAYIDGSTTTVQDEGYAVLGQTVATSTNASNLTATNFLGLATAAVIAGGAATIALRGGISIGHTGLVRNSVYYVSTAGVLSTTAGTPSVEVGTAVNATTMLLKDTDVVATAAVEYSSNFTAKGALTDGTPVILNTDGTVSIVGETDLSASTAGVNTAVEFNKDTRYTAIAFDALTPNKFVIAYTDKSDSNKGKAVVGTVNGSVLTFGATEYPFESVGGGGTNDGPLYTQIAFDPHTAGRFVVAYRHGSASIKTAVGSVTGDVIAFTTAVKFGTGPTDDGTASGDLDIKFDPIVANRVVLAYHQPVFSDTQGAARVGTLGISGIAFGPLYEFTAAAFANVGKRAISVSFDHRSIDKFAVAYVDGSQTGKLNIGILKGTSISFGSKYEYDGGSCRNTSVTYDPNTADKLVVAWRHNDAPINGRAKVLTVTGTVVNLTHAVVPFTSTTVQDIEAHFLTELPNQVFVSYRGASTIDRGTVAIGNITANTISFTTTPAVAWESVNAYSFHSLAFNPNSKGQFIASYATDALAAPEDGYAVVGQVPATVTNLTEGDFLGIPDKVYDALATDATVVLRGGITTNAKLPTGVFTVGTKYYVLPTGLISATAGVPIVELGTAVSTTTVLLKDKDVAFSLPSQEFQSDKVLTSNGSTASWKSSGGWTPIATITASQSTSLVLEGITSAYDTYALVFDNLSINSDLNMRIEVANAFLTTKYYSSLASWGKQGDPIRLAQGSDNSTDAMYLSRSVSDFTNFDSAISGTVFISGTGAGNRFSLRGDLGGASSNDLAVGMSSAAMHSDTSTVVTGLQLRSGTASSGRFSRGTVTLFGISKA